MKLTSIPSYVPIWTSASKIILSLIVHRKNNTQSYCDEGYTGVACASCERGYFKTESAECEKCPSKASSITRIIFIYIIFIIIITFIMRYLPLSLIIP